jgi:uncharacterized membrane protein
MTLAMSAWNELHPLVVHFPIALLLVAPLFVLMGALWPRRTGVYFLGSALILISVGTLAIFVSLYRRSFIQGNRADAGAGIIDRAA